MTLRAAASYIGADHVGFCARGPALSNLSVPWEWQAPECLAEFIQTHRVPPLATRYCGSSVPTNLTGRLRYRRCCDGQHFPRARPKRVSRGDRICWDRHVGGARMWGTWVGLLLQSG